MNKETYKIEPTEYGFKETIKYDMKDIEKENNFLLKEIDKINELRIIHKEELQIKELLNRIDKAINYIEQPYEYLSQAMIKLEIVKKILKLCNSKCAKETIKILTGGSNE